MFSDCAGPTHVVHVTDPSFAAGGGSPSEGQARPSCASRLVDVTAGQTAAPTFSLFTPVPLPTHFWGLTINDLGLSNDKTQTGYGETQPLPDAPMGVYDFTGRLVDTVTTDHNGMYAALEPSTGTLNCPLPAGPCPNMYRFVGNDPGQPGHVNANYNPRFRTIATNFQAWPGLFTVTDTAPTQVAAVAAAPGSTQVNPVSCELASSGPGATPQLFTADRPYLTKNAGDSRAITITGVGFGTRGAGSAVTLTPANGGTGIGATISSWSDTSITFTVSRNQALGPYSVLVRSSNGQSTVNGLTVHLLSTGKVGTNANPKLRQVNPPAAFAGTGVGNTTTVQGALEAAAAGTGQDLVVVFPGPAGQNNPTGAYFENLIVHSPVRLQGVGFGGFDAASRYVEGSTLNGLGFNPDTAAGLAWFALLNGLTYAGPQNVPDAAVVTVLARTGDLTSAYRTSIDGLNITGGGQSDFATNINDVTGGTVTPAGAPGALITQGGGIYVHGGTSFLRITNNLVNGNSGSYAGGIRIGTPYDPTGANDHVVISHNRITNNGGTNLAGGVGIFDGTTNYSVDHNDVCGNFSAEYGGGISHFGLSSRSATDSVGSTIDHNWIYRNQSYDEGGGVLVAGELPSDVNRPSAGSGKVTIDANLVQDNLANDDGGGIRFLQAGTWPLAVTNNIVVNNVSTHEGGGFALDDSTNVSILGNTVMQNITTATAVTSNGQPAPAGLSTATNSDQLQATLPANAPRFSKPTLRDDIFRGNVAGTWSPARGLVTGIGVLGDTTPLNYWDMGSIDSGVTLTPTYCVHPGRQLDLHVELRRHRRRFPAARADAMRHRGGPKAPPTNRISSTTSTDLKYPYCRSAGSR